MLSGVNHASVPSTHPVSVSALPGYFVFQPIRASDSIIININNLARQHFSIMGSVNQYDRNLLCPNKSMNRQWVGRMGG